MLSGVCAVPLVCVRSGPKQKAAKFLRRLAHHRHTPHPRGGGVPRRIANSQYILAETTKYRVRGRHELHGATPAETDTPVPEAHVHTASSTGEERRKRDHPIAPDRLHRFLHSLCPQASHSLTSAKIAAIDEDTPPSRALRCKDADEYTRRAKSSAPSSGRGSGTSSRRRPT